MDYNRMLRFHAENKADVTVAATRVPWEVTSQFGIIEADDKGRIVGFEEKPAKARSNLVSMGVYAWRAEALAAWLIQDAGLTDSRHDFGKDIVPGMIPSGRAYAYLSEDYWQDIGTLDAYFEANLDLLSPRPKLNLFDPDWKIHTPSAERPPVKFGPGGSASRSLIANGCIVLGRVERSVLFPGVFVGPDATVVDSIVMNDTRIEAKAHVNRVILDKSIQVGEGASIGWGESTSPNTAFPQLLHSGLTVVGKNARIPAQVRVGRNCCLAADIRDSDFNGSEIPCGSIVGQAG
jgi:glucose-1-phosphate adenylyltransferase